MERSRLVLLAVGPGFGLLGLAGFFDQFEITIASYDERIELVGIDC